MIILDLRPTREDAEFFWDERPIYLGGEFYSMPETTEELSAMLWWEILVTGGIAGGAYLFGGSGMGVMQTINFAGGQLLFGYPAGAEVAVTTIHGTRHWAVTGSPHTLLSGVGIDLYAVGSYGLRAVPYVLAAVVLAMGVSYPFDEFLKMADPHVQDWFGSNQGERRGDPRGSQA